MKMYHSLNIKSAAFLMLFFLANGIRVMAQPVVTSLNSTYSTIGSLMTINGTGFSAVSSENIVKFGSVRAQVISATTTQLKVTIPMSGMDNRISVTNTTNGLIGLSAQTFRNKYCPATTGGFDLAIFTNTPALSGLISPVASDVNGDGLTDIIGANSITNSISVQVAVAGSAFTFVPAVTFPASKAIIAKNVFVMADMDGDGKEDAIGAMVTTNHLYILKNLSTIGNVSFAAPVYVNLPGPSGPLTASDFDGDGRMDIAVASANNLYLLRNTSAGGAMSLTMASSIALTTSPVDISAGDIDNDGVDDLLISSPDGQAFLNQSSAGSFSFSNVSLPILASSLQTETADMDGDGVYDLLINYSTSSFKCFRNIGVPNAPAFAPGITIHGGAQSIGPGDLSGDGLPEPFYTMPFGWICTNDNLSTLGNCLFGVQRDRPDVGTDCSRFLRGDFNGDGIEDYGNMESNGSIFITTGTKGGILALNMTTSTTCGTSTGVASISNVVYNSAGPAPTYLWSTGSTTNTETNLVPGVYTVTVTSGTCSYVVDFEIVNVGFTSSATITQPYCINESGVAEITNQGAGSSFTYNWSDGQTTNPVSLAGGNYTVTVLNNLGCGQIQTVVIIPGVVNSISGGADVAVCAGESVTLSGSGGTNYFWTGGITDGAPFVPTTSGIYTVTGTGAPCPGDDDVMITVNPLPATAFTSSTNLLTVQFDDQTPGTVTSRLWEFGDGLTSTLTNPVHLYTTSGTYEVCLTTTNFYGCELRQCEVISLSSTAVENPIEFSITIAPNPVQDVLNVSFGQTIKGNMNLRVIDATGRLMSESQISGASAEVNVSDMASGIYFLELRNETGVSRTRFVKQD